MARLALPVSLAQLAFVAMGVVDTMVMGRVGAIDLGAVAIGHVYSFGIIIFGIGVLRGLDPFLAQAHGADDHRAFGDALLRGFVIATALGIPLTALHLLAGPFLAFANQPADIIPVADSYCRALIPGVLPMLWFVLFAQAIQNIGRPEQAMVVVLVANVANLGLDVVLVFGAELPGGLTIPAMGAVGCGWATTTVRLIMCVALAALSWPMLRERRPSPLAEAMGFKGLRKVLGVGLPVGVQTAMESWAFGAEGLLIGTMGTTALAAHGVAVNMVTLVFVITLGISAAAATRVGHHVGAKRPWKNASWAAISLGAGVMAIAAVIFTLIPEPLARLYTSDGSVLAVVVLLLPVAASAQVFDGVQSVSAGVLRGAGDTRVPALVNIFGFWVIALPLAWWLGVHQERGPVAVWACVALGLAVVAIILVVRVKVRIAKGALKVL